MPVGSAIEDSSYVWLTHDDVLALFMCELLANAKIQLIADFNLFAVRPDSNGHASLHRIAWRQDEKSVFLNISLDDYTVF